MGNLTLCLGYRMRAKMAESWNPSGPYACMFTHADSVREGRGSEERGGEEKEGRAEEGKGQEQSWEE